MRFSQRFACLFFTLAMLSVLPASAGDVNGTLAVDPARIAGADELGRILLYTPNPLEPGSSISHWDISASPDLLMEPFASPTVPLGEVDLTQPHFRDLGWPQGSSVITIRVTDAAEEGFNDPTVVAAAPNNPGGTTLGGQRLAALQWVAGVWAAQLGSSVEINIEASFAELDCGPNPEDGAVLAAAGSQFLFFDFPNAPRQGTWYHGALAEALAGEDLSTAEDGFPPEAGELIITFNSQIDEECLFPGYRYYYGLDGETPAGLAPFSSVALHEISHGLGFANFVNAAGSPPVFTGIPPMPDIYSVFTFDKDEQLHWSVMTNTQRRASAVNTNRVVWDGPQTTGAAPALLDNAPSFTINSPRSIEGSYSAQPAQFGLAIDLTGISGDLAVVDDGSGAPTEGCGSLVNASAVVGKIALVDRGECFFTDKVKNAQNAGAVAVIVVNNQPSGLPPMGGEDDGTITIPSAGISQADGDLIKGVLESRSIVIRRGGLRVTPAGPLTP